MAGLRRGLKGILFRVGIEVDEDPHGFKIATVQSVQNLMPVLHP